MRLDEIGATRMHVAGVEASLSRYVNGPPAWPITVAWLFCRVPKYSAVMRRLAAAGYNLAL